MIIEKKGKVFFMGILTSFVQYVVIMVILAALAVAGIFIGKALRKRSDEKKSAENAGNAVE